MHNLNFVIHSNNYYYDFCSMIDLLLSTNINQEYTIKIVTSFYKENDKLLQFNYTRYTKSFSIGNVCTRDLKINWKKRMFESCTMEKDINYLNEYKALKFFDIPRNDYNYRNNIFYEFLRILLREAKSDLMEHIFSLNEKFVKWCIIYDYTKKGVIPLEILKDIYDALFSNDGISKNYYQMDIKNILD